MKAANDNSKPKYPDVIVELTGNDGNAFAVLGSLFRNCSIDIYVLTLSSQFL